jgi:hypothetical protein
MERVTMNSKGGADFGWGLPINVKYLCIVL